jgi:hypothetical protein
MTCDMSTAMSAFIRTYADPRADLQAHFAATVVIPSVLRAELADALRSVFAQTIEGRIQILIGIDVFSNDVAMLDAICASRPPNCVVQVFWPGYSTSSRHGGISRAKDGGALRCVLSYLANSPFIAYLDDDNWWHPDHLRLLRQAIVHGDWAYSLRWYAHPASRRPICIDQWESVGPGKGLYNPQYGGFVDPGCLMISRPRCDTVFTLWNKPLTDDVSGMSADRMVFDALRGLFRGVGTGQPTAFYTLSPTDDVHLARLQLIGPAYDEAGAS